MKRGLSIALSVMLAALVSGCAMFSSSAPEPAPLVAFQPQASLKLLWRATLSEAEGYAFEPAVVNGAVYAADREGQVVKLTDGGQPVWKVDLAIPLSAGVGSDGSLVAVVSDDGELIVLDAENGQERWRSLIGAEVVAPPVVGAGLVVARATDSRLFAFKQQSGEEQWQVDREVPPLALHSASGVVLEEGVVVVGYPGGRLAAINAETGALLWELEVATPKGVTELERVTDVVGTAVIGRRDICAVAFQGQTACFDLSNGSTLWTRDIASSVGMARDARFAVITDDSNVVHGLDIFSGESRWSQKALGYRQVTRPLLLDQYVIVADIEGMVHVLDLDSGNFVARQKTPGGAAIPVVAQALGSQKFVVQAADGGLYAYAIGESGVQQQEVQ